MYKAKENGLLLLNPVTNRQFLTFLYYAKMPKNIAEVAYNSPFTIHYIYGDEKINTGQCTSYLDSYVMICERYFSIGFETYKHQDQLRVFYLLHTSKVSRSSSGLKIAKSNECLGAVLGAVLEAVLEQS